jgi:hypothetical protein
MLSTDLRHLKVWFDATRDGCEMTYEGAAAFSRELDAAIEKAEALEGNGIPRVRPAQLLTKAQLADPRVIPLPVLRREHNFDAA